MREIVSVFGLPNKPMEVEIPKDIVSRAPVSLKPRMLIYPIEHLNDVAL